MSTSFFYLAQCIKKIQLLRRRYLQQELMDLGLHPSQLPILEYIQQHEGCSQVEISQDLAVTPASIALSTKRMQKAGFLKKQADQDNLRCNRLSLTPKGAAASKACRESFDRFEKLMFDGFEQKELEQLEDYLDRMTMNITGEETNEVNMHVISSLIQQLKAHSQNPDAEL